MSYSRRDFHFAEAIAWELYSSRRVDPWFDAADLDAGLDWAATIGQAVRDSDALVLVASPAALRSPYVTGEWESALRAGTPVVVAVVGTWPVRLPVPLRASPVHDLRTGLRAGARRIAEEIATWSGPTPGAGGALARRPAAAGRDRRRWARVRHAPRLPVRVTAVLAVLLSVAAVLLAGGLCVLLGGGGSRASAGAAGAVRPVQRVAAGAVLLAAAGMAGWSAGALVRRVAGPAGLVAAVLGPALTLPLLPVLLPAAPGGPSAGPGLLRYLPGCPQGAGPARTVAVAAALVAAVALAIGLILRSADVRLWLAAGSGRGSPASGVPPLAVATGITGHPPPAWPVGGYRIIAAPADEGIALLIRAACRTAGLVEIERGRPGGRGDPLTFVLITAGVDWEQVSRQVPAAVYVLGGSVRFALDGAAAGHVHTLSRAQWIDLREQRPAAMRCFLARLGGGRALGVGSAVPPSEYDAFRAPAAVRRLVTASGTCLTAMAAAGVAAPLARPAAATVAVMVSGLAVGVPLLGLLGWAVAGRRVRRSRFTLLLVVTCLVTASWSAGLALVLQHAGGRVTGAAVPLTALAAALPVLGARDLRSLRRHWLPRCQPHRSRLLTPVLPRPVDRHLPWTFVTIACVIYAAFPAGLG
ncbi:toll/interleukin-1 receptor domain-containing protein [Frankia sp. QA3]|uniref:toll/interleukin-1 receptor domain-containing protein n=1 Tax=Frankia sp. QA3 TaxID=710111 RepID=UPI0018DEE7EB|nr:toll/interleukin-1 receptor domain-containing protein [Frankia sp. QA3]